MNEKTTTIVVKVSIWKRLSSFRRFPRDSLNDVIERLLNGEIKEDEKK